MAYLSDELSQINTQLSSLFPEYQIDAGELFGLLLQGKVTDVMKMLFSGMAQIFRGEAGSFAELAVMLLCIGLLTSLLLNLTELFENRQIGDMSFYFMYLFLMLILLRVFETVTGTAQSLLSDMLLFMELFMPVYFLAVGAAAGVTTALLYYQLILLVIYGMELLLSAFLMPLIKAYVFLAFMNGLWKEEKLQLFLGLIKRIAGYALKLSFAVITGISMLQSMITPVIDSVKLSAVQKAVGLIPGIGSISSSTAEMVLGSAVLIKNSAGVLAILLLVLLCAAPLVKIWALAMLLKLAAAVSGIISDRRITGCMDQVGEGSLLVLRTLLTACGLFLITIAITVMTTNRGF